MFDDPAPHGKGDSLEAAVRVLESEILKLSPGYSENTFHIQGKKIICVDGVHHEIDVWVNVEIGNGYSATYIFECRNRKKKTTKDDIIVFSEKIKAAQAQTGFFVTKSFDRGAKAQAASDPRIRLLRAVELELDEVPSQIAFFHAVEQTGIHAECNVKLKVAQETGEKSPLDLDSAVFVLNGENINLAEWVSAWGKELAERTINRFGTARVEEGSYTRPFEEVRTFSDGAVSINHQPVAHITLSGSVDARVWRGEIESRFEVETRGRVFRAVVKMPTGEVVMAMHSLAPLNRQQE